MAMARSDRKYAKALVFDPRHSNRRRRPKNDYDHQTHSKKQGLSDNRLAKMTMFIKFGVIIPVFNFWFRVEMRRPWMSVLKQNLVFVLQFNGNDR